MVESVGNYSRHRVVPVIRQYYDKDGSLNYEVLYLPAVSGQSIANAFMRALVDIAVDRKLPVCEQCRNYKVINGFPKRPSDVDKGVDNRVEECVVEDVTGFMATKEQKGQEKGTAIRRTSRIWFSYLLPDADSLKSVPPMPQFHVRYGKEEQMIYSIESGSAIYSVLVGIDIDGIGQKADGSYVINRLERISATFDAILLAFNNGYLGAKKARYLPQMEFLGGIATISHPYPFMVSPPRLKAINGKLEPWYINDTISRASKIVSTIDNINIELFYADKEFNTLINNRNIRVTKVENLEELVNAVKQATIQKYQKK